MYLRAELKITISCLTLTKHEVIWWDNFFGLFNKMLKKVPLFFYILSEMAFKCFLVFNLILYRSFLYWLHVLVNFIGAFFSDLIMFSRVYLFIDHVDYGLHFILYFVWNVVLNLILTLVQIMVDWLSIYELLSNFCIRYIQMFIFWKIVVQVVILLHHIFIIFVDYFYHSFL